MVGKLIRVTGETDTHGRGETHTRVGGKRVRVAGRRIHVWGIHTRVGASMEVIAPSPKIFYLRLNSLRRFPRADSQI